MPQQKRGLGKGLGALIPPTPESTAGVEEIDLTLIEPNPHQPRHVLRPEALQELAASIQESNSSRKSEVKAHSTSCSWT